MEHLADKLFIELGVTAVVLMLIMLYNNILLYKIKFKDLITQLVVVAMIICISEVVVDIVQFKPGLQWISYISECAATIGCVIIGVVLLKFVMARLGFDIKSKWLNTFVIRKRLPHRKAVTLIMGGADFIRGVHFSVKGGAKFICGGCILSKLKLLAT